MRQLCLTLCLVLSFGLWGCGPSAAARAALASLPPSLQAGGQLVLYTPPGTTCDAVFANSRAELELGGVPVHQRPGADQPLAVTVLRPEVQGSALVLEVSIDPQSRFLLRLPAGRHSRCVYSDTTAVMAAAQQIGRQVAFTPWKETCNELAIVGQAASSIVMDTDPVMTFEVATLTFGPASPADFASHPDDGGHLWFGIGNGLSVRGDTLQRCFSEPTSEAPSLAALLATPLERCLEDEADPDHLTCHTSLGIWEGEAAQDRVALHRVRRTLGAVHFHGTRPVSGVPYAKTVLALRTGAASGDLAESLLGMIRERVDRIVREAADDSVRLAAEGEPPTHDLIVRVETEVGEVKSHKVAQTSRYKAGEKTVTNPEKEPARRRLEKARAAVEDAQREYDDDVKAFDEAKKKAVDECRKQKEKVKNDAERLLLGSACDLGSVAINIVKPSRKALSAAESELQAAKAHERTTPETIQEDIMDTWRYDKTVFRRSASGVVKVSLLSKRSGEPVQVALPVSYDWEDYRVTPDPKHNVEGHEPARGPMESPEPLLQELAQRLGEPLEARLQAAVTHAKLEEARRALVEAGPQNSKPGFEVVDALAFQVAGTRIKNALFRGETAATDATPALLPSKQARIGADECVLAIATLAGDNAGHGRLELVADGESHADRRQRPIASLELCDYEVEDPPTLRAHVDEATKVRWGLYLTEGGDAAGLAVAPRPPAAAAPVATSPSMPTPPGNVPGAAGAQTSPADVAGLTPPSTVTNTAPATHLGVEGESCMADGDCQRGLVCEARECRAAGPPTQAQAPADALRGGVGESCRARPDCQRGLRCIRNTCTR